MPKLVTDRQLLKCIHDMYYKEFLSFGKGGAVRDSKIHVPIDCSRIAKKLGVDEDIVFGRLYYHLSRKYGYTATDGTVIGLFNLAAGNDKHVINFPLLQAVYAEHHTIWFQWVYPIFVSLVVAFFGFLIGMPL